MNLIYRYALIIAFLLNIFGAEAQSTRKKTVTQPTPISAPDSTQKKKVAAESSDEPVSEKPLRKEFNAAKSSEKYFMVPTGKSGVNIFYASPDKKKGMAEWNWNIYNNQFEEAGSKTFMVDAKMDYSDYFYDETNDHIYILFGKQEMNPSFPVVNGYRGKFEIVDLDTRTQSVARLSGEFLKKMHVNVFKAINGEAYIGGSVVPTNGQVRSAVCLTMLTCFIGGKKRFDVFPYLVRVNSKGPEEIKMPSQKQGEVLNLDYDSTAKKIFCTALDAPLPTDRNLIICEINSTTTAGKPITVKSNAGYYLLNAQVQSISATERIIIGSYLKSTGKDKLLFGIGRKTKNAMPPSTGLYILKLNGSKQDYLQYYPFSKFTDVKDAIQTVGKGKEKKITKLEDNLSFNILAHKIIQRGDQYVMVGDVYHAVYHTETYTSFENGKSVTHSRTVFDGWSFTFSLVAGFDKDGNMKWNSTFPLSGKLSWTLREQVKVLQNPNNDKIVLVYNYNGEIRSQVLNGETLEEQTSSVKIFTGSDTDKSKSTTNSMIEYWYGNYFIAYGYQSLEGKDEKGKKQKRTVFYLNKVSYR